MANINGIRIAVKKTKHLDTVVKFKMVTPNGHEILKIKPSSYRDENTFRDCIVTIPLCRIEKDGKFIYSFEFKKAHKGMEIMFYNGDLQVEKL